MTELSTDGSNDEDGLELSYTDKLEQSSPSSRFAVAEEERASLLVDESETTETDSSSNPRVQDETKAVTYWSLLRDNAPYRWYLASFLANHFGEWLTYLSSLTAIERLTHQQESQTLISYLVVCRLMTNVLFAPLGGALADGMDRRHVMILFDLGGALTAWLFVLAVNVYESVTLIFVATFLQEVLSGLYDPSRRSILPLLVNNEEEAMKKATMISGMTWSAMAAFGSATGGLLVSLFGIRTCFILDSLTYLLSAMFMFCIGEGNWYVSEESKNQDNRSDHKFSLLDKAKEMIWDGFCYIYSEAWGALVFLKFTVLWLTLDVLNVKFAQSGDEMDEAKEASRLGLLFGSVGIGCFVGPLVAEHFTEMSQPHTLQWACVVSVGLSACACLVMGTPFLSFGWLVVLTGVRASGVSVIWINSNLLLQKLSAPNFLGRVSSLDFALALIGESSSALMAGWLEDEHGLTAYQVCRVLGLLGLVFFVAWLAFHINGGGVATGPPQDSLLQKSKTAIKHKESDIEFASTKA